MMMNVDGHQLLTATGHPLHHLLVGHQRQLGSSQVHVPPSDNDENGNNGEVDDDEDDDDVVTIS